jgi:diadenosine tetraphosphate (Ap4A) HIT family hydrolase
VEKQAIRNQHDEIAQNETHVWLANYFPKFEGHTMIVPKRHLTSIQDETDAEAIGRNALIKTAAAALNRLYGNSGLEIFLQTGNGSQSTVPHLHWHLVPARPDDPLRSFEKLGHFYTTKENEEKIVIFPIEISLAKEDLQKALSKIL